VERDQGAQQSLQRGRVDMLLNGERFGELRAILQSLRQPQGARSGNSLRNPCAIDRAEELLPAFVGFGGVCGRHGAHSGVMPASRMTRPHFSYSARIRAAKASGESGVGSTPARANHSRASGDDSCRAMAAWAFATTGAGVAAVMAMPTQPSYS